MDDTLDDSEKADPAVGLAQVKKLWREHRSMIRQLEAAGIEPQPALVGFDPHGPLTEGRMREIRRRIQAWRHLLRPPHRARAGNGEASSP